MLMVHILNIKELRQVKKEWFSSCKSSAKLGATQRNKLYRREIQKSKGVAKTQFIANL